MSTTILRAGLLALAALLSACGNSLPPSVTQVPPANPPVDPDLPLPPKMRCAPATMSAPTLASAASCSPATEVSS
ncbi:MAG: hypothetical protein Q8Q73_01585 [Stagnimonas sp.]|nr:hypothetical protein [Stagnimonas sp.]